MSRLSIKIWQSWMTCIKFAADGLGPVQSSPTEARIRTDKTGSLTYDLVDEFVEQARISARKYEARHFE
jgi:hypothetical protein